MCLCVYVRWPVAFLICRTIVTQVLVLLHTLREQCDVCVFACAHSVHHDSSEFWRWCDKEEVVYVVRWSLLSLFVVASEYTQKVNSCLEPRRRNHDRIAALFAA